MENDQPKAEKSERWKKSGRERETLFRVTYMNQSNLIQIADNKANMIISINTMIISSIIAITGYGAIADKLDLQGSYTLVPLTLIILSCLASAILAIQAARPKIINTLNKPASGLRFSLLFFGNIASHSQQEYMEKMMQLLQNKKEVYEHMTIDIHNQGLVLKRKYNLLSHAYKVFMFGFASSVIIFLLFIGFR